MFDRNDLLYKDFGVFLCGGLLRVEKIKRLIDYLADFGYTSMRWEIGMYMDVEGEHPVVNFMGGKYSHEQIKDIDDYAYKHGIEVIPCVQVFKHNGCIKNYPEYKNAFGGDGYLSSGDPCVYDLIKKYFLTIKSLFRTNIVHIGMDETFELGRKGYIEQFGYEESGEIYIRHLRKVVTLAESLDLKCEMWGDMLKELARKFRRGSKDCTRNYLADFPSSVRVIEWFYGGAYNHNDLKEIFDCFDGVSELGYCDVVNSYIEYIPHNASGMNSYKAHADNIKDFNINTYLVSIWNDHHSCSLFAVLPSLFVCSLYCHGKTLDDVSKAYFKAKTGVSFDDFMLLDLVNYDIDWPREFAMTFFETDVFKQHNTLKKGGIFPKNIVVEGLNDKFADFAHKLKKVDAGEFSLIFDSTTKFAEAMSIKAELGFKLYNGYKNKDFKVLIDCINELEDFIVKTDTFTDAFIKRYTDEFQTSRFDVLCAKNLGSVRLNAIYDKLMLEKYLAGKMSAIEILEEQINGEKYGL